MRRLLEALLRNRLLLRDFVKRDLQARYVGSSMGFFWSVIFPIINLGVYMFVFRLVLNARWSDRQGPFEVALVMLAGIVVWSAFAETLSRTTNCLVENANLIKKVVFPAEILPWYLSGSSLINMMIGLPVVVGCVAFFAYISPPKVFLRTPGILQEGQWVPDAVELNEHHEPYRILMELTRGACRDVIVPFKVAGTATHGVDYLLEIDEARILAGDPRVEVLLTPLKDAEVEPRESIIIEMGSPVAARRIVPDPAQPWTTDRLELTLTDGPTEEIETPSPSQVQALVHPPRTPGEDYHPLGLGVSLLALPFLILLQGLFSVGLGYTLATLNLFLRDTYHLVGVGTTVWMFATPIFYPAFMVENEGFGWMLMLNPMHWLIECYRAVLVFGIWPDPLLVLRLMIVCVLLVWGGSKFFFSQKAKFPDLL